MGKSLEEKRMVDSVEGGREVKKSKDRNFVGVRGRQ